MTIVFFGKSKQRRKQPAHAPGRPQQHRDQNSSSTGSPERHHHSPQPAVTSHAHDPQRQHHPQYSGHHGQEHHYPPPQEPPHYPPPTAPQPIPPQYGAHGHMGYHPSQTTLNLHEYAPAPPMVTVSPPPSPGRPTTSPPPMYHAHSSPAWFPPPSTGPYYYPPDPYAAGSQPYLPYGLSPPAPPGQWAQSPSPPSVHVQWAPPPAPNPSPPSHPEPTSFNSRIDATLRKPQKMASQSFSNLNEAYKQKKKLASQSVVNLSDGLNRRQHMASKSVSNLNNSVCDRTNQYITHTISLCDLISNKLDNVITCIDDEVFSGNEQDLMIYEYPQAPIQQNDQPRGNNQNLAAAASSYTNHFSKVWQYSNSRLPPHLPPLKVYMPTWPLLCLAAQYSEKVYHKPIGDESETHVEPDWKHGTKAMVIKSVPIDDMNTVVFAIRGSAGFMDWAVNFRPAPTSPKDFLDDPGNLVHSGFLYVARKMVAPVAARLKNILAENPRRATCSLLITGHSAGGAVAALLYAHMMSTTVNTELTRLTHQFKRVHCVTFGAPPVSLLPIKKPDNPDRRHKKSLFFSFINEGDPVPRADKEVIKNLLRLYATSAPGSSIMPSVSTLTLSSSTNLLNSKGKKVKKGKSNSWSAPPPKSMPAWKVPPGALSCAGRLILLRDKPGTQQPPNPVGELNVEACVIADEQLRGVVFGDPMCHMMKLYARRIEILATRAVTAGGMDLG